MAKNIVLCLDGTRNRITAADQTNVLRLYDSLEHGMPEKQVAYYDPGVGTFSSPAAWTPAAQLISRVGGSIGGLGLRENMADAYRFIMMNYEPGDHVFLFGFSRGAFTARAVAGLMDVAGILRPSCLNLVPYVVGDYTRRVQFHRDTDNADDKYWSTLRTYAKVSGAPVGSDLGRYDHAPVHFLGLWDTVKAALLIPKQARWPLSTQLPHARTVRHALAVDERRSPYKPLPLSETNPSHLYVRDDQDHEEVWFAGVHSDVGGKHDADQDGGRLGNISLRWISEEAAKVGLLVDLGPAATEQDATARSYPNSRVWAPVSLRPRSIPNDARIHASVALRMERLHDYRPRLPDTSTTEHEDWVG